MKTQRTWRSQSFFSPSTGEVRPFRVIFGAPDGKINRLWTLLTSHISMSLVAHLPFPAAAANVPSNSGVQGRFL